MRHCAAGSGFEMVAVSKCRPGYRGGILNCCKICVAHPFTIHVRLLYGFFLLTISYLTRFQDVGAIGPVTPFSGNPSRPFQEILEIAVPERFLALCNDAGTSSGLTADGAVAGEIPSQPAVVGRSRPRDGGDKMLNDSAKRRDCLFDLTPGSWGTRTWGTSARNRGCSIGAVPDNRIWRTRGWPAAWPEVPGRAASSGAAPPGCVRSTLPTLRK